jgi:hypothetical protein
MSRNSFLTAVYQGALKSRCQVFQICCNVRDEGKLRRQIFDAYFVSQSGFKKGRRFRRTFWLGHGGGAAFLGPPWGRSGFGGPPWGAERLWGSAMGGGAAFLGPPWGADGLFWRGPQKSPPRNASGIWDPESGVKDSVGRGCGTMPCVSRFSRPRPEPPNPRTFLGRAPKKSPFFSGIMPLTKHKGRRARDQNSASA